MFLTLGDKGKEVIRIQSILKRLGLYNFLVDGDFGRLTLHAVKEFQEKQEILIDGVVGSNTYNLLISCNPLEFMMWHCSATKEGLDFGKDFIMKVHTSPKPTGRGWSKPGYRDIVKIDGNVENLVSYDYDPWIETGEITNGAKGMNLKTAHYCIIGGLDSLGKPKDTRTRSQLKTQKDIIFDFIKNYPKIKILGHNQVANKACPSYYVPYYLREIGVNEENIFEIK